MNGHDADTTSANVKSAVERFWLERAKGRPVCIDDLLDTIPGTPEHQSLRATVVQTIASQTVMFFKDPDPTVFDPKSSITKTLSQMGPVPEIEGYDIIACLGRGGMGAVYEGYQQSTGRRVAIKFMLDSIGATNAARKRFEREVEVVARLQHPGIVSIIDSGVRRGRYFYAMDFVQGQPLDEVFKPGQCDVRDVLETMAIICDAVEYAHQRGILHRDLKPGNIIVDEQGLPHLLDFGLAKVLEQESAEGRHAEMGLTVSGPGQLLGTVAYMSPEQAAGRHDETSVRTDVYALGAITYELLTGKLPAPTDGSLHDVLRRIQSIDPVAPSVHRAKLSRDLDATLLKSLEKVAERRYATAGEFAADLRRLLVGEPVLARRVNAAGRALRWMQRNRAVSGISAAAIVALVVVSSVLISRVIQERDVAKETFVFLQSILESADPEKGQGGGSVLHLLDAATAKLDDNPPERELAEAELREVLGIVYRKFGEYQRALEHQRRALDIRERRSGRRDDLHVAEALHHLAATLWWDGRYAEAEPHYIRSLEIRQRLYPSDHPAIAFSMTHLAACRLRMGEQDEARKMYEQVLAMRKRLYGDEHEEVAQALNNLAKCLLEADEFEKAETLHVQALDMIRRLAGDSHHGTASASQNLGECLLRRAEAHVIDGNDAEAALAAERAKDAFTLAMNIRQGIYPGGHHFVAASLEGLARAELQLGNLDRAHRLAMQSIDEFKRTRRENHPDFAGALGTLGSILAARGDALGSTSAFAEALAIAQTTRPPAELQVAHLRRELGMAHAKMNRLDHAEELLISSLNDLRRLRGDKALDTIVAARSVVQFLSMIGEDQRASRYMELAKLGP